MPAHPTFRPAALVLALGLCTLAPAARALDIVWQNVGSALSAQQSAAMEAAASYWEKKLTDNVTVYLSVSFADLGGNEFATTSSDRISLSYAEVRSRLAADAVTYVDKTSVIHMQPGAALSFIATQGDLTKRLDADGSVNNTQLWLTTANAKAVGVSTVNNAAAPDASIRFSNAFASSFSYTRDNGQVPANMIDFMSVAEHEIGHALGFVSGVDDVDFCIDNAAQCGLANTVDRFEDKPWYMPLDLLRYTYGQLDVSVGAPVSLSIDGGGDLHARFSSGVFHGNGQKASHFSNAGLMQSVLPGHLYDARESDMIAMDAIGWDLANEVPEPAPYAMLLGGLVALGFMRRRHG